MQEPAGGGVLVKTLALSLDPAMRGWMNDAKSYIPPVGIGEVMRAGGVGKVIASQNPKFAVGDLVSASLGVQEYLLVAEDQIKRNGVCQDRSAAGHPSTQWLNVLGMPGMTGYFGLLDIGQPKPGETVVVSGAAGAVGQTVGQLARIKGCRVGRHRRRPRQVRLGGERARLRRLHRLQGRQRQGGAEGALPQGVDIYFDNVGGDILDDVLARLARGARIVICGAISQYNNTTPVQGPKNYLSLLVNRARMEGMVVFDYADRFPVAVAELAGYLKDGRMKSKEDVVHGLETFPEALVKLFTGENFGKLVLQVAQA